MTLVLRRKTAAAVPARDDRDDAAHVNRLGRSVLLVLALVTAVLVAAVLTLWYQVNQAAATAEARTEAVDSAKQAAKEILSFDYRTLDHDLGAATRRTTGEFTKKYEDTMRKGLLVQAQKTQSIVQTEVEAAAVVEASPERVDVLLFLNQISVKAGADEPSIHLQRTRFIMAKVGDRWLVAGAGLPPDVN